MMAACLRFVLFHATSLTDILKDRPEIINGFVGIKYCKSRSPRLGAANARTRRRSRTCLP